MRRRRRERTIRVAVRPRWGRPTLRKPIADELPAVPGLVIVRWRSGLYTLTHEATGKGIDPFGASLTACRELASRVADLCDWTHPEDLDEEQRERARVDLRRAVESVNPFKGMSAAARRRYRERGL